MKLPVAKRKVISDRRAELVKAVKYNNITVTIRSASEVERSNRTCGAKDLGVLSSMMNQNPKSMLDAVKTPLMYSGLTEVLGNKAYPKPMMSNRQA
jgi:hypothetical protein